MRTGALALSVALAAAAAFGETETPRELVVEPELSDEVLVNPLSGWQMCFHQGPQDEAQKMPEIGTYYYRSCWCDFQAGPDKYDGDAVRTIDSLLEYAKKNGKYVGIRVVTYNAKNPAWQHGANSKWQGCDSALPTCVWQAGAKGFEEPGGAKNWVPCFWDKVYLDEMEKLIAALGKRWSGHPNLAYVDIGGGNWGEMNLRNTGIPSLDDLSVWKQNGLTPDAWHQMIVRSVDFYKKAFPKQQIIIAADFGSYGKGDETVEYAVKNGVGFRDDGNGMFYSTAGRTNREFERYWKQVLCLFENGYSDWTYGGWGGSAGVRGCLEWDINQCHAGVIMVGKGAATINAYNAHKALIAELGRKLGYRYEVQKASYFSHPRRGSQFNFQMLVRNAGNVPCYFDAKLELSLVTDAGAVVHQEMFDAQPPVRQWMPGETVRAAVAFKIPANCPTGKLALCIGIVRADLPEWRLALPLKKDAGNRRYVLGLVNVRTSSMNLTRGSGGSGEESAPAAGAAPDAAEAPEAGPLAAYAEKLKAPAELEAAREFARASELYAGLAKSAADEKARGALNALERSARAGEAMKAQIISAAAGRGPSVYVTVAGRKLRGKVGSAGAGGLKVSAMGQELIVAWKDLDDASLFRLAKDCAGESAEMQMEILRFAAKAGLAEQVAEQLAEIAKKLPDRAAEARQIAGGQ